METTAVKLYSTGYREAKTYLAAALFVAGNIVLPQICHLVPQGGLRWLPIYFFTLVGAYKYGWRCPCWRASSSSTSCSARWANGPGRARRPPPCRTSASGSPVCWHRYLQDTRCSGTYYVINNPKT